MKGRWRKGLGRRLTDGSSDRDADDLDESTADEAIPISATTTTVIDDKAATTIVAGKTDEPAPAAVTVTVTETASH